VVLASFKEIDGQPSGNAVADLILVKHAAPRIVEEQAPSEWVLSDAGKLQCERLAARLAHRRLGRVIGSEEHKAAETAKLLGLHLRLPSATRPGLQENDRTGLPFFPDITEFHARIEAFFSAPADRLIGLETADQAHDRFVMSIDGLLSETPAEPVAVVSHGAVISLFVARANDLDPYRFWLELGFASFAVLSRPDYALREVVHDSVVSIENERDGARELAR
jgi:broad specificity phosphatase PhoE